MSEQEVRDDFKTALESVEHGEDLSAVLEHRFSDEDLTNLARIHNENPGLREKIEDLLTDCRFYTECNMFHDKKYSYCTDYDEIKASF